MQGVPEEEQTLVCVRIMPEGIKLTFGNRQLLGRFSWFPFRLISGGIYPFMQESFQDF